MKHEWECEACGRFVMFRQPELPSDHPQSEQQESKVCAMCGGDMYFDEVPEAIVTKLETPSLEQIAQELDDEEDDTLPVL